MSDLIKMNLSNFKANIDNISLEFNISGETLCTSGISGSSGTSGFAGRIGPTGPQGSMGIQGRIGPTGPQGSQGKIGDIGSQGTSGTSGIGIIGSTGPQGTSGTSGVGYIGPTGPQGLQGKTGPTGPQGKIGPTGPQGHIGATGPQGSMGVSGSSGINGSFFGSSGISGVSGTSGTSGINGKDGIGLLNLIEQIDFNLYISGKTNTILSDYAWYPYFISNLAFKTDIGTCKIDIRINNNPVIGMTDVSGTTTNNIYYAYSLVSIGDCVDIKYNEQNKNVSEIYGSLKTIRSPHYIGEEYGGGIIFYVWSGGTHGLISMKNDGPLLEWGCVGVSIGSTVTSIGSGKQNTINICNMCSDINIAARYCNDLNYNGYNDWFLPSKDELIKLYNERLIIGNFFDDFAYWSSSEFSNNDGIDQYFINGYGITNHWKNWQQRVRAIREF